MLVNTYLMSLIYTRTRQYCNLSSTICVHRSCNIDLLNHDGDADRPTQIQWPWNTAAQVMLGLRAVCASGSPTARATELHVSLAPVACCARPDGRRHEHDQKKRGHGGATCSHCAWRRWPAKTIGALGLTAGHTLRTSCRIPLGKEWNEHHDNGGARARGLLAPRRLERIGAAGMIRRSAAVVSRFAAIAYLRVNCGGARRWSMNGSWFEMRRMHECAMWS
jgi:hypothetical protein